MNSKQPVWEYITNLGDVHPIDHGGYFVLKDKTGVYTPEAIKLIPDYDPDYDDDCNKWTIYRFILEKCTYINNVLSDNKFHPNYPVWFSTETKLNDMASFNGMSRIELINNFISNNIIDNAIAWEIVGDYFGYYELDNYPQHFTDINDLESYMTNIIKYIKE